MWLGGYSATYSPQSTHLSLLLAYAVCTPNDVGPETWPVAKGHHY